MEIHDDKIEDAGTEKFGSTEKGGSKFWKVQTLLGAPSTIAAAKVRDTYQSGVIQGTSDAKLIK